jgi:hypothetical protein
MSQPSPKEVLSRINAVFRDESQESAEAAILALTHAATLIEDDTPIDDEAWLSLTDDMRQVIFSGGVKLLMETWEVLSAEDAKEKAR